VTKLVIQIPCYNEAETLPETLADLPESIHGIDEVDILVVDDGSTDGTAAVAEKAGVDQVVRVPKNRGLAHAFALGLETSLAMGADIIVNTDADNQYRADYIPNLIKPIQDGKAEIVIGDRQVNTIEHFSGAKKFLQKLGSWVVRWASGTDIPDTTSGFRAISRDAALRLTIFSGYTYTLETIIQAGKKGISITSVPIATNPRTRHSRLVKNTLHYVGVSAMTIMRIFLMYEALRVFLSLSLVPLLVGAGLILRFVYYFAIGDGSGHIQSLIVAAILLVFAFMTILLGLLADLIARNRRLMEEIRYGLRKQEHDRRDP
jgi:glycosyltransferase involved in cell wall biosynthesis